VAVEVTIIRFSMVNAYLLKTGAGFFLIDTGFSWQRGRLKRALKMAGCKPGDLKLVVITHADFDHTGNCAWLQKKYGVPIAIHRAESAAVERGRMLLSRKNPRGMIVRALMDIMGFLVFRRFKPAILVEEGDNLTTYGLEARILHTPGHSMGSIGVLTADGRFFCGDLFTNNHKPLKCPYVDDEKDLDASIERLKDLNIVMVYPGHGQPFTMIDYRRVKD
jgi:hydroxyacylglutathione hydrolase